MTLFGLKNRQHSQCHVGRNKHRNKSLLTRVRLFPTWLFLGALAVCTNAQVSNQTTQGRDRGASVGVVQGGGRKTIRESDGLSYNIVNAIRPDRQGFIWIATFDGLNRFDGTHFKIYKNNRRDTSSLLNNTAHDVVEDRTGNIWCATTGGASCLMVGAEQWVNHKFKAKDADIIFFDALCDRQGKLWFSGIGGLFGYDPQTKVWKHFKHDKNDPESLTNSNIKKRGMVEDPEREGLWLCCDDGLNYFDTRRGKAQNFRTNPDHPLFKQRSAAALALSHDGHLLFGDISAHQIVRFNPRHLQVVQRYTPPIGQSDFLPAYMFEDSQRKIWVCNWTYHLFTVDATNGQTTRLVPDGNGNPPAIGTFFWHIYEDRENTLWVGSVNGVVCLNEQASFYKTHYFPFAISAVAEDRNGIWWIGFLTSNGICRYDPFNGDKKYYLKNIGKQNFIIKSIEFAGPLCWAATSKGLYRMRQGEKDFKRVRGPVPKQAEWDVSEALAQGDSLLWVFSGEKGLFLFNTRTGDWISDSIPLPNGHKTLDVRAIGRNYLGHLAIYFSNHDLAIYNPIRKQFETWHLPMLETTHPDARWPWGMYIDGRYAWLAFKTLGFFRYDLQTKAIDAWSESEGLAFNYVLNLEMDRRGRVWLPAYNKLSVFDPVTASFQNYNFPLSEDDYTYFNKIQRLRSGKILNTLGKYLVEIDPERYPGPVSRMKPLLHEARVYNREKSILAQGGTLELQPEENNFSIEYGLPSGLQSKGWRFQYRLPPFYADWINHEQRTNVTFTNVPGGTYSFEVRTVAADGSWASEATTLKVVVVPPLYKTGWFQFLVALLAALAIVWVLRQRIKRIRAAESQKNAFNKMVNAWQLKALRAQMNPHFVFNCMNSIDTYILRHDTENASRYLNKFALLVRLILHHSDRHNIPLEKELEMLRYYVELEAMRFEQPFQFEFKVAPDIDTADTEIPSMLLQPYVENAIVHGLRPKKDGQGQLVLDIQLKENMLYCTITDNGIGRERAAAIRKPHTTGHESRGLKLAEERLAVLQQETQQTAKVQIIDLFDDTGKAQGTRVELMVPV